ncbi:MAG: alanine--glyoxylate aminotransferase family protein [Myxococcales bacterium]|nr:MAG: alanine--glyoxylate aminotransferase family protein [Myxococcales bacterium]
MNQHVGYLLLQRVADKSGKCRMVDPLIHLAQVYGLVLAPRQLALDISLEISGDCQRTLCKSLLTMKQYWLLNPGPVNTSETVKQASISVDLCHREPEYAELMQAIRTKLLEVAGLKQGEHHVALIAGSGTAAVELGLVSIVRPGKKLLTVKNGVYGDRMANMAARSGIDCVSVEVPWGELPDLKKIETLLKSDPDIDALSLVHHETTTGLINPVDAIGQLCKATDTLFYLDSVSGFAGEELDIKASHIDFMAATANKCIHGLPGMSFVIVSDKGRKHLEQVPPRSAYFDLGNYLKTQDTGNVPFTPCVPGALSLNQALDELAQSGGIQARIKLYKERSSFLRGEFKKLGLQFYIDENLLSNSITTYHLPKGFNYAKLHDALKEQGFVIYAGQGKLGSEVFRIANIGHVPMSAYADLVDCMRQLLREQ